MNRVVGIFIEGVQLELFNDEQINVTSSVQNISDISKVYNFWNSDKFFLH